MNKVKVSGGVASALLLASLFTGIGTTLTIAVLLLIFCEVEDFKKVLVRVLSFAVAMFILTEGWDLLVGLYDLFLTIINSLVTFIDSFLTKPLDVSGFYRYCLTPIKTIISMIDSIFDYVIAVIKLGFIVIFLKKKDVKETFLSKLISNFVNSFGN